MDVLSILAGILIGGIISVLYDIISNYHNKNKLKNDFDRSQIEIKKTLSKKKENYEKEIKEEINDKIMQLKSDLTQLTDDFEIKKEDYSEKLKILDKQYEERKKYYKKLDDEYDKQRQEENVNKIVKEKEELKNKLEEEKNYYEEKKEALHKNFQLWKEKIDLQKATLSTEINAFEETIKSIVNYQKQLEEIKLKEEFYHISLTDSEKADIVKLKELSKLFGKPEVLFKIIYETYYKTKLEELFKRILGEDKDKGGIYKITNINNKKSYVGKTVKFIDRFRTHAKRGCGLERISGQIYEAMFNEGIENFTWEIIEICSKEDQTEREKFWIKTLQTDSYGYNMKVG